MKKLYRCLATLFAMVLITFFARAASPEVPENSWQQLSGGIALSLILRNHLIDIHVKNTSSTLKVLLSEGSGLLVQPFFIDDSGAKVRLGDHPLKNVPSVINDTIQKTPQPIEIPPGGEAATKIAIPITTDEANLLKTHPVTCSILIYDPATKQKTNIESPPKLISIIQ